MLEPVDTLKNADVGVVIGRFQVATLHSEHVALVRTVQTRHQRVIVFLGVSPGRVTKRNPLDFAARREMFREVFPEIVDVYPLHDQQEDACWSKQLDVLVNTYAGDKQAVLYGSRDSFKAHYTGRYPVRELEPRNPVSGTELRRATGNASLTSVDARAGVIWAVENQYEHPWNTVDVAIFDENTERVVLGRKSSDPIGQYRFIGGFVRTKLAKVRTLEANVVAETSEETGLEISAPKYVGSAVIDDWRYRGEDNQVMTVLFAAKRIFGAAVGADDIEAVSWHGINTLRESQMVEGHRPLLRLLHEWLLAGNRP